jgi:hypothetical protein
MDNPRQAGFLWHNNLMNKTGPMPDIFDVKTKTNKHLFSIILPDHILLYLKGKTKEAAIDELLDMLASQGKLSNRDSALKDLLNREQAMTTAIPNSIANTPRQNSRR